MKTFVAGVAHALLFADDELFVDAKTLTDSSLNFGVTAENVQGGEGNVIWGQYFHDCTFGLTLTDAMFSLEYIAAQTGATWSHMGDVFMNEEVVATAGGEITLSRTPVAVNSGSNTAYIYYSIAGSGKDKQKIAATGTTVQLPAECQNQKICVTYRYTSHTADMITISSQYIPKTLHAVLTIALYAGDSCNLGASTNKIGQIEIDIPRFQLSGTNDITMTAAGVASTSLEGTALASGCQSCDGKAIYATITRTYFGQNAENFDSVVIEDGNFSLANGEKKQLNAYAVFTNMEPHQMENSDTSAIAWAVAATGSTYLSVDKGLVTCLADIPTGGVQVTATVTLDGVSKSGSVTVTKRV